MNNIPKGYKLVPVEPTRSMVLAGLKALGGCVGSCGESSPPDGGDINDTFSAMLDAAPTPPQPIYDEAAELNLFEAWYEDYVKQGWSVSKAGTRTAWLACAKSRDKAGEVGHE